MPTPHYGQPRYRWIADELRHRIHAGVIPAGALLPAESALIAEFRVSRGTIREAIGMLRNEGLVITEQGRGTYARPNLPVRRLGPDRYRLKPQPPNTNGPGGMVDSRADNGDNGDTDQVEANYREVPATAELAELFEVKPGTMLLERRLLTSAHGIPQQLTTSYYLLDMVASTPVADPDREPWPGGHVAQLASLGITVTSVRETVRARMPSVEEAEALRISSGVPVLAVTRSTFAETRLIEAAVGAIFPGDRIELEFEISDGYSA